MMKAGKIISISNMRVEILLEQNKVKPGDIVSTEHNGIHRFEIARDVIEPRNGGDAHELGRCQMGELALDVFDRCTRDTGSAGERLDRA